MGGKESVDEEAGFGRRIGVLTVVRLQSVGMCGCVAGVAGAALEAVVVLLLAVADAVHAVHLARGELHALDVHLCETERTNTTVISSAHRQETVYFHLAVGVFMRGARCACGLNPDSGGHYLWNKQADLCTPTANPHPLINKCKCVYLIQD